MCRSSRMCHIPRSGSYSRRHGASSCTGTSTAGSSAFCFGGDTSSQLFTFADVQFTCFCNLAPVALCESNHSQLDARDRHCHYSSDQRAPCRTGDRLEFELDGTPLCFDRQSVDAAYATYVTNAVCRDALPWIGNDILLV